MSAEQPTGPGTGPREASPSEAEIQAALEEQMRRISVEDVLLQTAATLINLGARRLGLGPEESRAQEKDLGQARLAIEAARALSPLLADDQAAALREPLSQLQIAYAREAKGAEPAGAEAVRAGAPGASAQGAEASGAGAEPEPGVGSERGEAPEGQPSREPDADEAARERARAKIWTPPGS